MIQLLGIIVFALLLYLGQKYVYAKIWQRDLKVSLSFREDGIWEGQESELSEIIENRKRLPLTMLKVKFQTDRHLVFADTKGSRTTDRYYRNDISRSDVWRRSPEHCTLPAEEEVITPYRRRILSRPICS